MPIKFTKDVSTHLFKYITNIDIKFNAFDARSRAARELLRQVESTRFMKVNPKLKIGLDIHNRADAPTVEFNFVDGTNEMFEAHKFNAKDMMFQVNLRAMQIDAEYEMADKNIDDAM